MPFSFREWLIFDQRLESFGTEPCSTITVTEGSTCDKSSSWLDLAPGDFALPPGPIKIIIQPLGIVGPTTKRLTKTFPRCEGLRGGRRERDRHFLAVWESWRLFELDSLAVNNSFDRD